MSLFPRFEAEPAAKTANPANVPAPDGNGDVPVSNFRNFSRPTPLEFQSTAYSSDIARRVADLADAWHERMVICLEAGDISVAEVTAAQEVGRAFARHLVHRRTDEERDPIRADAFFEPANAGERPVKVRHSPRGFDGIGAARGSAALHVHLGTT